MLETLKRWLGRDEVSDYERHTLAREYHRLGEKITRIDQQLGTVNCSTCPKSLNPKAKRLIAKKRKHERRQAEIEDRLGEVPSAEEIPSRRGSRRADA